MTAADQVLVLARLANGAPLSLHYVGGMPKVADGFVWDIHGTLGDIRVTAPFGHAQMAQLSLMGAKTGETAMRALAVPERFPWANFEFLPKDSLTLTALFPLSDR